jgi:hypothetical protein
MRRSSWGAAEITYRAALSRPTSGVRGAFRAFGVES